MELGEEGRNEWSGDVCTSRWRGDEYRELVRPGRAVRCVLQHRAGAADADPAELRARPVAAAADPRADVAELRGAALDHAVAGLHPRRDRSIAASGDRVAVGDRAARR